MQAKIWLEKALFEPETKSQTIFSLTILLLIMSSITVLATSAQYPELKRNYRSFFTVFEWFITIIFTIETILRLILRPRPKQYLFTRYFLIDCLAVLPTWLGLFLPSSIELSWLRSFRVLRILRAMKFVKHANEIKSTSWGMLARIAPYMAIAFSIKAVVLYFEELGYWPQFNGLETTISVIGFAVGVLLTSKLSLAMKRMYKFEEHIAYLIGSVEATRYLSPDRDLLFAWLYSLYVLVITDEGRDRFDELNDQLINTHKDIIPHPTWISLHTNAQFIVHRIKTYTPEAYDKVLSSIVVLYVLAVLLIIPGATGLLSSFLVVYILGGLFLVAETMDSPHDPHRNTLINSDLSSLEDYLYTVYGKKPAV